MNANAQDFFFCGLVPFAVAAIVFGLSLRRGVRGHQLLPRIGAALAAGLGFLMGYATLAWAVLTPEDSEHWLPYLVLGAMILGILFVWLSWPVRAILALGLSVVAAYLLVPDFEVLKPRLLAWQLAVGGSIFSTWLITDQAMSRRPDMRWGWCWLLTLMAVAVEMKLAYIGKFMQLALLLAAPMMPFALAECKRSWRGAVSSVAPILAVTVPGLLWLGRFNSSSEVPFSSYLSILAGPLGFSLCQLLPDRLGRIRSALAHVLLLGCLGWGLYEAACVSDFAPL